MKKVLETSICMVIGALLLVAGVWTGSAISGKNTYHAGTQEQVIMDKAKAIDSLVQADNIQNKFTASRKANELTNVDTEKLNEAIKKGITVIIVPEEDVLQSSVINDKSQAEKNKANGIVTDCAYIPQAKRLVVSLNAPSGVLVDQLNNILALK